MGLLKHPTGVFSRRSCSGVSAVRRSAPCAPAPRRQRHPPLRPSLRLLRAPSPRKGQDKRATRALAFRSAFRALPLLRFPARGRHAPRLALRRCSRSSAPAPVAPRGAPRRCFFAAPLLAGGSPLRPLAGVSAPAKGVTRPRRMKGRAVCARRVYHPPAPPIKAGSARVHKFNGSRLRNRKIRAFFWYKR